MTGNITAEDHSNRHYVTDTTAVQQQLEDPEPAGELNLNDKQDHKIIDIEELLNNWLKKAV